MKTRPPVMARATLLVCAAGSLLLASLAFAQSTPAFTYAKPDEVKPADPTKPGPPPGPPPVEWKAMVKGGYTMTSGNSETTGFVVGGTASRKEGNNKLSLEAGAAYGHSDVLSPTIVTDMTVMPNTNTITGLSRTNIETTNNWATKGRYDRFFTLNNSGYVSAQAAADEIAGKSFYGGGQIGYSRQVFKNAMHLAVAELGYDLSYQRYVPVPMTTHDPVTIHSARVFVGETLKLTAATGINASVEALFNLNKEGNALIATSTPTNPPATGVDAFKDTRVNAKLGLTTTLIKRLSIGFGFTLKYEQNPAPLPIPSGSPGNATFAAGFTPFAEKVDTLTEATLIYTFL